MIANLLNYLITAFYLIIPLEGKSYYGSTYICNWEKTYDHQVITLVPAFCSLCYHIYIRTDGYKKEVF